MKNGGILRKIVSLVISSILICNIPVFASNVQSNANRQENRLVSTIGQTDDVVATTYEAATTNAKLNSLNGSFHTIQKNVDYLINNCFSKLTVWIDSTNNTYASKTVTLLKGSTTVGSCTMKANGTHYEAVFEKLPDGAYTVKYQYILSNGTVQSLTASITVQGKDVSKRLYGDLFQMSIPEIQQACKAKEIHELAHVGDTISDGRYTYTIIGINQDKPSDENGTLLPESSYGDVLTLMPLGALVGASNGQPVTVNEEAMPWDYSAQMNGADTSSSGWESTNMRKRTMPQCLAKLPAETQNVIGYVQKISGRPSLSTDSTDYENGRSNVITGDKCFLLSEKEILGYTWCATGNEENATFQYQYFKSIAKSDESRCLVPFSWLRSAYYSGTDCFTLLYNVKQLTCAWSASTKASILPAFCIY